MTNRRTRRRPAIETLEGRALLTAGALDTSFGGTGMVTHDFGWSISGLPTQAVAIQPWDGKVVVTIPYVDGSAASGKPDFALARYNPDGSLDTTFGKGGLATASFGGGGAQLDAIAIDPTSHDIYGVGQGQSQLTVAVARFTPAGALDATFGKGGEVTVAAGKPYIYNGGAAAAVDPSGHLVVAGSATTYDSKNYFYPSVGAIYRFTTTGALDTTLNGTGKVIAPFFDDNDGSSALQLEPSGSTYQIAVAGVYDNNNTLAVYNANGTPATSVGSNGVATLNASNPNDSTLDQFQPNGQLIEMQSGGSPMTVTLDRYNTNGTPDTTFGTGGQATLNSTALPTGAGFDALTVDLSGRIVLAGSDTVPAPNGKTKSAALLTRLTPAGALDTTFGTGGSVTQDFGAYGSKYRVLAVYPQGTSHAGEVLAAGTNQIAPNPSPYDELALALYQSNAPAVRVASPPTSAAPLSPTGAIPQGPLFLAMPPDGPDLPTWPEAKDRRKG